MRPIRLLAAATALLMMPVTNAQAANSPEHCVVRVVGQRPSGELVTTTPSCDRSFDVAMQGAGADGGGQTAPPRSTAEMDSYNSTASDFILGTHYDGFNFSGDSFTVVGSDCLGGYTNLTSTWDNRVSSTANGCYRVKHFASSNLTGSSETKLGAGGNLSTLNNNSESIQYLS